MSISRSSSPAMITTGILSSPYLSSKWKASGIISADSAAEAQICDGRSAISFGNSLNLAGADLGPKIIAVIAGHIILLITGETVWPMTSPTTGIAGADMATTSGRIVG